MTNRDLFAIAAIVLTMVIAILCGYGVEWTMSLEALKVRTVACRQVGGYLVGENCLPACGVSMATSVPTKLDATQ